MDRPGVVDVLRHVGGTATAAALVSVSGRANLDHALRAGLVVRAARGRYVLADLPHPWTSAFRLGGVVSHTSAAQHWGLAVLSRADRAHITVARTRSRVIRRGVTAHWSDLAPVDVATDRPVTTPLRTVLDCVRTLPFGEGLAIADSALRQRLVGSIELSRAADALRGPGRARARRVAAFADPRAESGLESALRAVFLQCGLAGFVPQVQIRDGAFRARVDLADTRLGIVAEADSFEHHGHRAALVRDCERYDELVVRGWRVLRFAWEQVMFRSDWVAAVAVAAARAPRRRPTNMRKAA